MAVSQASYNAIESVIVHRAAENEALSSLKLSFSMSDEILCKSSVLEHLVDALSIGASESITAPRGDVESWARFSHGQLLCSGADDASLLKLIKVMHLLIYTRGFVFPELSGQCRVLIAFWQWALHVCIAMHALTDHGEFLCRLYSVYMNTNILHVYILNGTERFCASFSVYAHHVCLY